MKSKLLNRGLILSALLFTHSYWYYGQAFAGHPGEAPIVNGCAALIEVEMLHKLGGTEFMEVAGIVSDPELEGPQLTPLMNPASKYIILAAQPYAGARYFLPMNGQTIGEATPDFTPYFGHRSPYGTRQLLFWTNSQAQGILRFSDATRVIFNGNPTADPRAPESKPTNKDLLASLRQRTSKERLDIALNEGKQRTEIETAKLLELAAQVPNLIGRALEVRIQIDSAALQSDDHIAALSALSTSRPMVNQVFDWIEARLQPYFTALEKLQQTVISKNFFADDPTTGKKYERKIAELKTAIEAKRRLLRQACISAHLDGLVDLQQNLDTKLAQLRSASADDAVIEEALQKIRSRDTILRKIHRPGDVVDQKIVDAQNKVLAPQRERDAASRKANDDKRLRIVWGSIEETKFLIRIIGLTPKAEAAIAEDGSAEFFEEVGEDGVARRRRDASTWMLGSVQRALLEAADLGVTRSVLVVTEDDHIVGGALYAVGFHYPMPNGLALYHHTDYRDTGKIAALALFLRCFEQGIDWTQTQLKTIPGMAPHLLGGVDITKAEYRAGLEQQKAAGVAVTSPGEDYGPILERYLRFTAEERERFLAPDLDLTGRQQMLRTPYIEPVQTKTERKGVRPAAAPNGEAATTVQ